MQFKFEILCGRHFPSACDIACRTSSFARKVESRSWWMEAADCVSSAASEKHGFMGLQGTKIPLEAGVLAIADSLDAMVSRRPYRDPRPFSVALDEVKRGAGRQFDGGIVELLARQGESTAWSPMAPSVLTKPRLSA
jgi:hypothetical protein